MPETAEAIAEKPEVRKELQRATGEKPGQTVKARGRDKFWFVAYALVLAGCVVLFFLLGARLVPLPQPMVDLLRRILRGAGLIVIVLALAKAASVYALGRIEDASTRFTLQRVVHLVVAMIIVLVVISIIFVNWYAAVAALGIGSIIIGSAGNTSPAIIRAAVSSNFLMRKCLMRSCGITPGRCFLTSGTKSNFRSHIRAT